MSKKRNKESNIFINHSTQKSIVEKNNQSGNFYLAIICFFYFLIHFIPNFGALDAMGSQWFYIVILDFLVAIFIYSKKNDCQVSSINILQSCFSKIYLAFFVIAGLSIFTAINPTESLVCIVRIIATIIAYFNISILLNGKLDLFKWLAQMLAVFLLIESLQSISQFVYGAGNISFDTLILSLKGTTENKNIFAADLAIKIPFVIYCIHSSKLSIKVFNSIILLLSVFTLFIVNARASYVSLFLIVILYAIFILNNYYQERKHTKSLFQFSFLLFPIIVAIFFSQFEIANVKSLQEEKSSYGSVTDRISTIASISKNKERFELWTEALNYSKNHPFIGCGIGNWKLASIPYGKATYDDGTVPMHAHNDFLENFAELGVFGGILYLGLFVCIYFFTFSVLRSDASKETKLISFITLLSFIGYSIDAFFNFPFERPITQILFAFIVAVNINAFIISRKETQKENGFSKKTINIKNLYCLLAFIFLLPAGFITYQTYKSLVAQNTIIADHENQPLRLTWNEVVPVLPSIPNLSVMAQSLDAIKARYLIEADKNEEALLYLKKAAKANPYMGYAEFLKAGIYMKLGKMDSAYSNATDAFYKRPRAVPRYQTLIAVLAKMKDTLHIQQAFNEVLKYRNEPYAWNLYLMGMLQAKIKGDEKLLRLADSSLRLFPENEDLRVRKNEISYTMGIPNGNLKNMPADNTKEQQYFAEGVANFNLAKELASQNNSEASKEKNRLAVKNFLLAAVNNPNNFVYFENAGLAYLNMNDFSNALVNLKKAISLKIASDGKTEYFSGIALLNLGRKEEGCTYLQKAVNLGWKEAAITMNSNCK